MHCEFLQRRAPILAHFRLDPPSVPLWSWEPKSAESPWTWQRSPECAVYEISWKLLKCWCFGNGIVKLEVINSIHHNERPHGPESNLFSVVCTIRGWMNQKKLHRGAPDPSAESSSPSFFHLLHMWGPDFCEVAFCCGILLWDSYLISGLADISQTASPLSSLVCLEAQGSVLTGPPGEVAVDLKVDSQSGTWPCSSSCFLLCVHLKNSECSARLGVLCSPG